MYHRPLAMDKAITYRYSPIRLHSTSYIKKAPLLLDLMNIDLRSGFTIYRRETRTQDSTASDTLVQGYRQDENCPGNLSSYLLERVGVGVSRCTNASFRTTVQNKTSPSYVRYTNSESSFVFNLFYITTQQTSAMRLVSQDITFVIKNCKELLISQYPRKNTKILTQISYLFSFQIIAPFNYLGEHDNHFYVANISMETKVNTMKLVMRLLHE